MSTSSRSSITIAIALAVGAGSGSAQHMMQPVADASMHTTHQAYSVETFGIFQRMMLTGDFSAKVRLGAAMKMQPSTGVGAVADARGEISIYDGKLIISYGKTGPQPDPDSESAALLAMASAAQWQTVAVERDVEPGDIEAYLAAAAKAHGIDPELSFPFELRGVVAPYAMHVNAEPTGGPHGMGLPMAVTVESKGDRIEGGVAGLYVSTDLVGVATHGGERTHAHWISADGASTAHLDRWGVKAGTVLLLPRP